MGASSALFRRSNRLSTAVPITAPITARIPCLPPRPSRLSFLLSGPPPSYSNVLTSSENAYRRWDGIVRGRGSAGGKGDRYAIRCFSHQRRCHAITQGASAPPGRPRGGMNPSKGEGNIPRCRWLGPHPQGLPILDLRWLRRLQPDMRNISFHCATRVA